MISLNWHLDAQIKTGQFYEFSRRYRDWFLAGGPNDARVEAIYWQTESARVSWEERAARIGEGA